MPLKYAPFNHRRRMLVIGGGMVAASALVGAASSRAAGPYEDPDRMLEALRTGPAETIRIGGGTLRIVFAEGAPGLDRRRTLEWIRRCAIAVTTYFGRYPVREHGILVFADSGARVAHGVTYGYGSSSTQVSVGIDADTEVLSRDWVMVHEMIHTALPNLPRRALWLQEGNATYVEPIARAQAGQLAPENVWRDSVAGMPKGLPDPGEGGMDGTHAWGRLYWGGATFWLLAEIALYEKSGGKYMLRDALRVINRASGGNKVLWTPEQMMQTADAAAGNDIMSTLYHRFADAQVTTDLPAIFGRLGVVSQPDGSITFDDRAPLAGLRRRMTQA